MGENSSNLVTLESGYPSSGVDFSYESPFRQKRFHKIATSVLVDAFNLLLLQAVCVQFAIVQCFTLKMLCLNRSTKRP
jgi:hypothetical protein